MDTKEIVISRNPTDFGLKLFLLQQNNKLCDATLLVNGERIDVHANILAASSEFFHDIFIISAVKEVIFNDVDKDIMHSLIEYCYTGTLATTELKIEQTIKMAQNLSITTLIKSCVGILERRLNLDNCLLTWKISQAEKFDDLKRVSLEFIKWNFASISESQQLLTLNYSEIEEVIGSGLPFSDENIYDTIKKWVNYDTLSRAKNLTNLLEHVHLERFPHDFLISESLSLCKLNPFCQEKFSNAIESQRIYINTDCDNVNTIMAIGSVNFPDAITMEVFNRLNQQWFEIKDMNCDSDNFSAAFLNGKLLIIRRDKNKHTVRSYDLTSGRMETLPNLSYPRVWGRSVNLKGNVYYIGGYEGNPTSFVEMWNFNSKSWSAVAPLNEARHDCGVAVLGDQIFVVGGDDLDSLSSTESYNPTTDEWKYCSDMNEARCYHGVAAVGGYLYAVGGMNNGTCLNSAERYDPTLDRWTYIQSLEVAKYWIGASNFMGKLVIAGGKTHTTTFSDVEYYDDKENKWKPMPSLKKCRSTLYLVEIPLPLAQLAILRNA